MRSIFYITQYIGNCIVQICKVTIKLLLMSTASSCCKASDSNSERLQVLLNIINSCYIFILQ